MRDRRVVIAGTRKSGTDRGNRTISVARDRIEEVVPLLDDGSDGFLADSDDGREPLVSFCQRLLGTTRAAQEVGSGPGPRARPFRRVEEIGPPVAFASGEHLIQARKRVEY